MSKDDSSHPDAPRFPAQLLREQITLVLSSWGMPDDLVEITAGVMVDTDLAGIESHGIQMLDFYEGLVRGGELRPSARPEVVRETAVSALVDGGGGLGHAAATLGMEQAVAKAREAGVGVVGVRNSHHFGAAGHYAAIAAEAGMIGLVTTTTRTIAVVPTRGTLPRLGTNPIAFAAPTGPGRPPFLLDMSTTTVAINKVRVYELKGRPLPPGWVLDTHGNSITDPAQAAAQILHSTDGGLTPLGGEAERGSHKGYGLGVMVHVLAGALTGSAFGPLREPDGPVDVGHFFLALDPGLFRDRQDFVRDVDAVIDVLHDTPPADPELPVLVAGDPEAISRTERERTGIPVPPTLIERLRGVCERSGVPLLLDTSSALGQ